MKDSNFLKEHNAKSLWHPMAHPADSLANPPKIIVGGEDADGLDNDTLDLRGAAEAVNPGGSLSVEYNATDPEAGVVYEQA